MKYDYVIVLCASVMDLNGKFAQFEGGKYLGGQVRMDAAVVLAKENKATKFILVGGYNKDDGIKDSRYYRESKKTSDMKKYLIQNGIKSKRLKVVNSLPCTRHNLVAVFNKYKSELSVKEVTIGLLTNQYHLPRAVGFWINLQKDFDWITVKPIPIAAENILGGMKDDRYLPSLCYISRVEEELIGMVDIELDIYKDSCLGSKKFPDFERVVDEHYTGKTNDLLTIKDIDTGIKK